MKSGSSFSVDLYQYGDRQRRSSLNKGGRPAARFVALATRVSPRFSHQPSMMGAATKVLMESQMRVGHFMNTKVVTIRPDATVADAARLMLAGDISGLPVTDPAGHVVGIVTEHDLLRRHTAGVGWQPLHWLQLMIERSEIVNESDRFREAKVEEVMTRNPLTVAEDTPIGEACHLVEKHGIKRLPVVREGRLVGIIARTDLVRALGIAVHKIAHADERAARFEELIAELQRESMLHRARSRR
jgi:CBS domain-containing protein